MKIFITGSTQGIGRAMAKAFVERGDEVTVHCSGDIEKAKRVAAEIGAAHAVVADLSVAEEVNSLYSKTGPVDCLILNASVQYRTPWLEIEDYELDRQIDINFKSTLKLMQAYYPAMKENGGYVFASDHSIPNSVSFENMKIISELAHKLGRY